MNKEVACPMPSISDAEFEVMKVIWANEPINTNDVVKKLSEISIWSPKTIHTLLSRLVKKGALDYQKDGRVFVYRSTISQSDYLDTESQSFLNRFYNGAINSLLISFIENEKLSDEDINELTKSLERLKGKRTE